MYLLVGINEGVFWVLASYVECTEGAIYRFTFVNNLCQKIIKDNVNEDSF